MVGLEGESLVMNQASSSFEDGDGKLPPPIAHSLRPNPAGKVDVSQADATDATHSPDATPAVEFRNVSVQNGSFELQNINLQIPRGSYTVLLGRTGSGKSTLLEILCGLRRPQSGQILVAGTDITDWEAASRGIGYVPQDGALFSSMTVRQQLALPLQIRKVKRGQIYQRVNSIAAKFGLDGLLDRYPKPRGGKPGGLSGGERQRVALARALIFEPKVLCLDEPLSSLDDQSRESLYPVLQSAVSDFGATVLHVTHSRTEADRLGTVEIQLIDGKLSIR
jgi:molybdate/tungstate transport system ATP-binding protein